MQSDNFILEISKLHFTVGLYEDTLRIDLKGSVKEEIEEALENKPVLRQTIGGILSMFVPLHIRLSDVDTVQMDKTGKAKLILPRHRNVTIPLEPKEAKKLIDKLNELISKKKQKKAERVIRERKLHKIQEQEEEMERAATSFGARYGTMPPPPGVSEEIKEAEREIEEQEE